ncbi:MAG: hypothetical protein K8U03_06640 [Planctomycetia bacterium]|nr:hypothetical protein [Planctomycetia bacterium]
MSVMSGKDGKVMIGVATIADVTKWTLRTTSNNVAYASSSTAGFRRRVAGVKDGSGTIAFKLDVDDPITNRLNEGQAVTLLLYLDDVRHYSVPAVIDALQWEVDIDRGDILGGIAEFSIDGAWTKPTYS